MKGYIIGYSVLTDGARYLHRNEILIPEKGMSIRVRPEWGDVTAHLLLNQHYTIVREIDVPDVLVQSAEKYIVALANLQEHKIIAEQLLPK